MILKVLRKLQPSSIERRITIYFSIAFIVMLGIAGIFTNLVIKSSITSIIYEELNNSTIAIKNMVQASASASLKSYLQSSAKANKDIVSSYYEKVTSGEMDEATAKKIVAEILRSQKIGSDGYVYVLDTNGIIQVHPDETLINTNSIFRDEILEKKVYGEEFKLYRFKGRDKALYRSYFKPWNWIISTTAYKDDFIDVINIEELQKKCNEMTVGESGYAFVIDLLGNVIVHPTESGTNCYNIEGTNGQKFLQEIIDAKNGKINYSWKGPHDIMARDKIAVFRFVPEFNWIVASTCYTEEIFSPLTNLRDGTVIVILLLMLMTIFISLVVSQSISRPIHALISKFNEKIDLNKKPTFVETNLIEMTQLNSSYYDFMSTIKEYSEKLEDAHMYTKAVVDSMSSIIIAVTNECRVTQWNREAEIITGISFEEAYNKKLTVIFPRIEDIKQSVQTAIRTQKIQQITKHLNDNGFDKTYENITIYPTLIEGVNGAVIRIDDVTNEQILEEKLAHSRKMDAIGQLAGGIAHDFNNMLAGILSATQVLMSPKIHVDELGKTYIDMIYKAASLAGELTSKLLSFGRKAELSNRELSIDTIIDDVILLVGRTLDKKISITVDKKAQNNWFKGDSSAIQNSLINLIINASHAMKSGVIAINTRNVDFDKSFCDISQFDIEPGEYIEIEVRDNGEGIPDENLKKIFEPFFTTKAQGKGTGLGLSAVYGIVKNHNGLISVYSEVGIGTVFYIYLPCIFKKGGKERKMIPLRVCSGTILLIDDEEMIRISGKYLLEEMGYKVILASSGIEGISIYRKEFETIDIVVSDMSMPDMDGEETFRRMKEINNSCKFIIASGFTKEESLASLKDHGVLGFIQKPYRDYELSELISEILVSET